MLNSVDVNVLAGRSPLETVDPLVLNLINRPITDLYKVRNIDGLGAVKAAINTTPFGSIDGEFYTGRNVPKRNIVITLGMDANWSDWTPSKLRRNLDKYFTPGMKVELVFDTDDLAPVQISGYVEANEPNIFSKDPENQISILCPDPYFSSVDPHVLTGHTDDDLLDVDYIGTIDTGINILIEHVSGSVSGAQLFTIRNSIPELWALQIDDNDVPLVDATHKIEVNSIPGAKYIRKTNLSTLVVTNILDKLLAGGHFGGFYPGLNKFQIAKGGGGVQQWTVTYFDRFGSL